MDRWVRCRAMIKTSLLALCAAAHVCHAASPPSSLSPAQSIAATGWQLVRTLPQGNVVVSPYSIWTALGMAHPGANATTAQEMAKVLHAPNNNAFFAQHTAQLHQILGLPHDKRVQLHSANRLWVQEDLGLKPTFITTLQKQFHSSVGRVNFREQAEPARATINQWVAQQTGQHIQELMPRDSIGQHTALVLANALYMKAPWTFAFPPDSTRAEAFQLDRQRSVQTPFMHQRIEAMVGTVGQGDHAATVCELPYANGQLKMVLYVPKRVQGLDAVLAHMDSTQPNLAMRTVTLSLPKWKAQQSLELSEALKKLGMRQAFDRRDADFSGMRSDQDLFISHVVHQSVVEVSEVGTEAAAATGVGIMFKTALPIEPPQPLNLRADRPFAWTIVESSTGTPLFAGVVREPRL